MEHSQDSDVFLAQQRCAFKIFYSTVIAFLLHISIGQGFTDTSDYNANDTFLPETDK